MRVLEGLLSALVFVVPSCKPHQMAVLGFSHWRSAWIGVFGDAALSIVYSCGFAVSGRKKPWLSPVGLARKGDRHENDRSA